MLKKLFVLLICLLVVTPLAMAQDGASREDYQVNAAGLNRDYQVYAPASYDAAVPTPLVIMLHGLTSNIRDIEIYTEISQKADEAGFLLAYPQALGGDASIWLTYDDTQIPNPDLDFMAAMLDAIQADYTIDNRRIYVIGYSAGGGFAHRMACNMSDQIAAIATGGGIYTLTDPCTPSRPMPVFSIHAYGDPTVPYDGVPLLFSGVREWISGWVERNECFGDPEMVRPESIIDGEIWLNCGATVALFSVDANTHNWAGGGGLPAEPIPFEAFETNDFIWDFLAPHKLPLSD